MAGTNQRLDEIVRLADFEALARLTMEPAAYDYVAGGAWDELSLAENEAAWGRWRFRPRVLVDVSSVDPSTTLLGAPAAIPLAIAPMSVQAIAHPDAELATFRAAATAGVPFILSTMSSRSIEEVAATATDATRWFQLYLQGEAGVSRSFVERAEAAGFGAIVLTVDLPVLGYRERDMRTGFELPHLGNFVAASPSHRAGLRSVVEGVDGHGAFATPTWDDVATIRSWSSLPLVLKGILTAEDARIAVEHGVDGVIVSNHGARQLDRTPAPVDVLAEVVAAIDGRAEVWVDGGIRRGLDIAIAIALGARGVLLGKPVYYALAAGGHRGVERALEILRQEFEIALKLLGAPTPALLRPEHLVAAPKRGA